VVLVSGFAKKTDKVPSHDLAMAENRRRDYLSRKGKNE
jgi:phage-related protein